MIIVDNALAARQQAGQPIRVGLIGAGFMARGVVRQICCYVPGMELVAIANRTVGKARQAYEDAGQLGVQEVGGIGHLEDCIRRGIPAVTDDALLLCQAEGIDAILEMTGAVEHGAHVALEAFRYGKHLVSFNAELDGTAGAILRVYAERAGVVYTLADGDQPGVTMNLVRFVRGLGVRPVLCGNIKGLHDPYRNPTTQEGFARQWGQNLSMVTSFADGSKISYEQAVVANATGMQVLQRGMTGPTVPVGTPIRQAAEWYPVEALIAADSPGYVDYVVGAEPGPGVFVLGTIDDAVQQHYLNLYKLGKGPLYCFYTPYHLCHFEAPHSVARAVLFGDATLAAVAPTVEVITAAKVPLTAGTTLDGIGHYHTYGLAENAPVVQRQRLLPLGVAEGCVLRHDVPKDHVLTYDDVLLPEGRLIDRLRREQQEHFTLVPARAEATPVAVDLD